MIAEQTFPNVVQPGPLAAAFARTPAGRPVSVVLAFACFCGCSGQIPELPRNDSASAPGTGVVRGGPRGLKNGLQSQTGLRFVDVTSTAGVAFAYHDGQEAGYFAMVETLGGGGGRLRL